MIDVCFTASTADLAKLESLANALKRHFRLRPIPASPVWARTARARTPARLHVTERRLPGPYSVDRDRGVSVSMWDSHGISYYAGIDEQTYLLVCSLLGVSQWRVLAHNDLLRPEDLRHPANVRCLFATPDLIQDYALHLEEPRICEGCVHFYHCLGADPELIVLHEVITEIHRGRHYGTRRLTKVESDQP